MPGCAPTPANLSFCPGAPAPIFWPLHLCWQKKRRGRQKPASIAAPSLSWKGRNPGRNQKTSIEVKRGGTRSCNSPFCDINTTNTEQICSLHIGRSLPRCRIAHAFSLTHCLWFFKQGKKVTPEEVPTFQEGNQNSPEKGWFTLS